MLEVMKLRYMKLMQGIEDLEDRIEIIELKDMNSPKLAPLREELAEQRNELARVSDGCGTPHHH